MNIRIKALCMALIFLMNAILFSGCSSKPSDNSAVDIGPTLTIDFSHVVGDMKPVNGINNGPVSQSFMENGELKWKLDAAEYYKLCGIPMVRTHDTEYPDGSDRFIDIHCIFPDMSKDPGDPKAYHFQDTDEYIKSILDSGAGVYYRLGESIAVSADNAVYQRPPEDYLKWAKICAHIIAHYNHGWNHGYEYNIQYWQIWNEPDQARQWAGEAEDYYELYRITARLLKERYPEVYIGASAPASADQDNLQAFFDGIKADGQDTPLDFIGWHIYTNDPSAIIYRAELVRKILDQNGYDHAETFLDEWNYVDDWNQINTSWEKIKSPSIAAFYSACMIVMQNTTLDGAMYYDGALTGDHAAWCGLYDSEGSLLPGFYGFYYMARMIELGHQVNITSRREPSEQGIYVCAASGTDSQGILIANTGDKRIRMQINMNSPYTFAEITRVNDDNPAGIAEADNSFSNQEVVEIANGELLFIRLFNGS